MMQSAIRFIVFDWDGTLMDSERQIVSCLHAAIADLRLHPVDDDTVKNVIGLGLREAIDTLVPGQDGRFQEAFVAAYRKHWFQSADSTLFSGVREVLALLRERNLLMGVATGKARRGLNKVLGETGLGDYFHATRCADETLSKPHPQMLLELMAEVDVTPVQTLMVGDTEYDMEMASNADVRKIAVSSGVHEAARLRRHDPLVCLENISNLPAWLVDSGLIHG
jgi:phosphoglycolate phosphatase